jgi:hypothetical protein
MFSSSPDRVQNWIFVTGVIRSGTTFVGKVLSLPWQVDYIHEPFNGGFTLPERTPFQERYIRPGRSDAEAEAFRRTVEHLFRYDFALDTNHHPSDSLLRAIFKTIFGSRGPVQLKLAKLNPIHTAAVIKDPMGKLLTEYLYLQFDVKPVIVVRHPVSLAASFKRVGWWPEVKDFLNEPDLMEDYFSEDADVLRRSWPSRFLESMGHWRAAYKLLLTQARKYPDWQVVTHESISENPLSEFKRLYEALNLPWSPALARRINRLTGTRNSTEASHGRAMDLKRNSARIFEMRRDELTVEERRAIFDVVKDVALDVYSKECFALGSV